jgi:hypothetical protein
VYHSRETMRQWLVHRPFQQNLPHPPGGRVCSCAAGRHARKGDVRPVCTLPYTAMSGPPRCISLVCAASEWAT